MDKKDSFRIPSVYSRMRSNSSQHMDKRNLPSSFRGGKEELLWLLKAETMAKGYVFRDICVRTALKYDQTT